MPELVGPPGDLGGTTAGSAFAPPTGTGCVPPAAGFPIPSSSTSTRSAPLPIVTSCNCMPSVVKPPTFTWLSVICPVFTGDWGYP